jgi:peptidoglycan-N-acetylglucosamine deacetylase
VKAAAELGYQTVLWDIDSRDWKRPGKQKISSQVLHSVQPGSIILLHASDSSTQTAEALPLILAGLQEKNLNPVTLSCLLAAASH